MSGSAVENVTVVGQRKPLLTATPRCVVQIFPFEGGRYVLDSGSTAALVSVETTESVQGLGGGFVIELAPGGPNGISARPSWAEVITPMSLVVIGMQRGRSSRITMIGVVKTPTEESVRQVGEARRNIMIVGQDFSTFFNGFSFYNLPVLMSINAGVLGDLGYLSTLSDGLLHGTPDSMGAAWYSKVMAGSQGILGRTQFAYTQGSRVLFSALMSTVFEPYPAAVTIPMSTDFLGAGSFASKFATFFPFPWYELFLDTAPASAYGGVKGYTAAATPISLPGFQAASPTLVARVNPLPTLTADVTGGSDTPTTFSLDTSRWSALPVNTLNGHGEREFYTTYDDSEVRNFYVINPLLLSRSFGAGAGSNSPFLYIFSSWLDNASIHRYGYRPQITETYWFSDPDGFAAKQNTANGVTFQDFQNLVSSLALKVAAYHEPTPLMARAVSVSELRPDIMPGTRFRHTPYRDKVEWEFYNETVTNRYQFGGTSTTRLGLTRGLPTTVYEDADLLLAIHTGNAQRVNGTYQKGLPPNIGDPLASINFNTVQNLLADNALMFSTPQANNPASSPLQNGAP